jgi:hypothetical protein
MAALRPEGFYVVRQSGIWGDAGQLQRDFYPAPCTIQLLQNIPEKSP